MRLRHTVRPTKGKPSGPSAIWPVSAFILAKTSALTGDAGAIVTNDENWALKARMVANHGRIHKYNHEIEGVNSRMDGIQAAILEVKIEHLPGVDGKAPEKRLSL